MVSPSTESHVYQYTRSIPSFTALGGEQLEALLEPLRLPGVGGRERRPPALVLPLPAGHESSVTQIGSLPSLRSAMCRRTIFTILITFSVLPVYGCSVTTSNEPRAPSS